MSARNTRRAVGVSAARRRVRILGMVLCAFAAGVPSGAWAAATAPQYEIEVGDVLEFSVASLPALRQRTAVDINGDVNFPLLQDIRAAGLPLAELRTKVRELISAKPFRQRGAEGHETLLTIDPDEITISIVEYRPIYITGDVGHPGEQPFRPGITVRQAIALGGGSNSGGLRTGNVAFQEADFRAEYQTLWTALLGQRSTIDRLDAELDNKGVFQQAVVDSAPIGAAVQQAILQRESAQLASRMEDYAKEKQFIGRSIDEADRFLATLKDQQSNEKQGADLDAQDFDRVNTLFSKGAVPITRVTDARRSMLLSSTRQLQTSVQVAESEIRKDGLLHSLDKLDDQRRADLLKQLQAATLESMTLQSKLRAVVEKMAFTEKASGLSADDATVEVEIYRQDGSSAKASDETALQPGDVVKVKIKNDLLQTLAAQ